MLRICPSFIGESASVMKVDTKRKQITLYDPSTATHVSTAKRKMGVAAPKIFAFDAIYEPSAKQTDVCSGTLVDILQTVVGGSDACVFTYGHSGLGESLSCLILKPFILFPFCFLLSFFKPNFIDTFK